MNIPLYKNMHLNNTQKKNRNPSKKETRALEERDDMTYEWLESPPDQESGTQPNDDAYETLPVIEY